MERFTNAELVDMHQIYGLVEENAREANKFYLEKYPHRIEHDRRALVIYITIWVNMDHYDGQGIVKGAASYSNSQLQTQCVEYRSKEP